MCICVQGLSRKCPTIVNITRTALAGLVVISWVGERHWDPNGELVLGRSKFIHYEI